MWGAKLISVNVCFGFLLPCHLNSSLAYETKILRLQKAPRRNFYRGTRRSRDLGTLCHTIIVAFLFVCCESCLSWMNYSNLKWYCSCDPESLLFQNWKSCAGEGDFLYCHNITIRAPNKSRKTFLSLGIRLKIIFALVTSVVVHTN